MSGKTETSFSTSGHAARFKEFLLGIEPIRLIEPLAETLGAFENEGAVLDYSFVDAIKMAGHSCPTVAGAYLCCQEAIKALYPGTDIAVRGEIAVVVYGGPDESSYGAMAQVITLITGAAPITGFKGLGGRFARKDLLTFSAEKPDPSAVCFEFKRLETGKTVLVKFFPWNVPFSEEKAQRMGELIGPVAAGIAPPENKKEFQSIWMEKIRCMLVERSDIQNWLQVEES